METENYTRIPDSIRKDKTLSPLHKMIIGYLTTYQTKPDGTSTNLVYFNTQETLAEELGTPIRTLKKAIEFLESKEIIYQPKKGDMDGKRYYKNRKAIVLVDKFHLLPIEFKTISTEVIPEVKKDIIVAKIEENKVLESIDDIFKEPFNLSVFEEEEEEEEEEILDKTLNEIHKLGYSEIKVGNCYIPSAYIEYWDIVKDNLGDINKLKKIYTQKDFNQVLQKLIRLQLEKTW